MTDFKSGDIVARKSYGGDINFRIVDVNTRSESKPVYILKSLIYRLEADADAQDLIKQNPADAYLEAYRELLKVKRRSQLERGFFISSIFSRLRVRPGRILHIDGDKDFLNKCLDFYREARVRSVGKAITESSQPQAVRSLLEQYRPDILVVTGHDGIKKGASKMNSIESYRNSKYYIESTKEARKFEPNPDKLCVFAGACQSYYEAIMAEGANFASSPGRILINALDPGIVSKKIALTDSKTIVTPGQIAEITVSGSKGIGGIDTKGQMATM